MPALRLTKSLRLRAQRSASLGSKGPIGELLFRVSTTNQLAASILTTTAYQPMGSVR